MLNTNSLNAVDGAKYSQRFIKPLYDSYCFSALPQTVEFLLTGEGEIALPGDCFGNLPTNYDKVILLFVDGFGWRFFQQFAEKYPFLKTCLRQGVASQMTSQFPSTTAAHVTCIHTGMNVGQSGVYEWNYYEPMVDEVITPLLFTYSVEKKRDTLKQSGIAAEAFFPSQTLYQKLQIKGITSYIFQHESYTPSTFSNCVFKGARVLSFKRFSEALSNLVELITAATAAKTYYFLYFDKIDAVCHTYGPQSHQFEDVVDSFLRMMEEFLYEHLNGKIGQALLILTADHGQVEVDPRRTIYLNKQNLNIEQYLQRNQNGKLLVPAGSARDMFLHVKEQYIDETVMLLQHRLANIAEVYYTEQLIAQDFFGSTQPSKEFLARVGNVVILPYQHETVWWYEEGKFGMHFKGHHGGLTPEEMKIPLLLLPL
ncbi:MAG TPA: alkaline phosphatase family protein [Ktedonobacteraceae bacterium]|nr:alkaline phosphatase family protein [Ktedonobacteraceae bacterium]